jgi:hypothetical protein
MKPILLDEPELEFGADKHIDIRFGIMNYGPLDFQSSLAPKQINIGIVGTPQTKEGLLTWLENCKSEVAPKESSFTNLYPHFPGFNLEKGFQSTLTCDERLQYTISDMFFEKLSKNDDFNGLVSNAVITVMQELQALSEKKPDLVVCAMPKSLQEAIEENRSPVGRFAKKPIEKKFDFHDMLKAASMRLGIPIQLVWPATYDPSKKVKSKAKKGGGRQLQDEATRAWNFHTALYYKAGGIPWRILRKSTDLETCYVGISFYKSLTGEQLQTSMAQVFNERGEGVIVRGGVVKVSKDDRQVHLETSDAHALLYAALEKYRQEHKHLPARVVIHKTSNFNEAELEGFGKAIQDQRVESADFIHITRTSSRLFREGIHAPLRGTFFPIGVEHNILYTRGTVNFYQVYPGLHIPHPIIFNCRHSEQTPRFLAEEILTLSKMNWNNTQFDGSEPMTLTASKKVGSILKYIPLENEIVAAYRFYM